MPTGYTADLTAETTFREFALRCARAFGATIMMRDDPLDKPIPDEFHADESGYYKVAIDAALMQAEKYRNMTVAEAKIEMQAENERTLASRKESQERSDDRRETYQRMIDRVAVWEPPTPDHENMKAFMLQQLNDSMKWDCRDEASTAKLYPLFTGTPEEWLATKRVQAEQNVQDRTESLKEEVTRTRQRNEWVKALRESLREKATA